MRVRLQAKRESERKRAATLAASHTARRRLNAMRRSRSASLTLCCCGVEMRQRAIAALSCCLSQHRHTTAHTNSSNRGGHDIPGDEEAMIEIVAAGKAKQSEQNPDPVKSTPQQNNQTNLTMPSDTNTGQIAHGCVTVCCVGNLSALWRCKLFGVAAVRSRSVEQHTEQARIAVRRWRV